MKGFRVKQQAAPILLAVDWSRAGAGSAAADDLGWTIRPTDGGPQRLRVRRQVLRGGVSRAELVGGVGGEIYVVGATARTEAGRILRHSMVVRVADQ